MLWLATSLLWPLPVAEHHLGVPLEVAEDSRRSRPIKASCLPCGRAATPVETGVAENDRTAWSRPPSNTPAQAHGLTKRTSRKPASSAAAFSSAPRGQLNGPFIRSASSAGTRGL